MTARIRDTADQFSRQAEAYAESPTHARGADLDLLVELARPVAGELCLDVATGPGHTAFRLATQTGLVIGADIAPGMLATARRLARERDARNLLFQPADVHALPFAAACFDLVTCRIAPHHFADVGLALREVARVLKPGGRFVLEDSLGPDDSELAAFLEDLEKRRDPTHVHSLDRREWAQVFDAAGLHRSHESVYAKEHDFERWIRRTGLAEATVAAIERRILAAPERVRRAFFAIDGESVVTLHDRKLMVRAEKPADA